MPDDETEEPEEPEDAAADTPADADIAIIPHHDGLRSAERPGAFLKQTIEIIEFFY